MIKTFTIQQEKAIEEKVAQFSRDYEHIRPYHDCCIEVLEEK